MQIEKIPVIGDFAEKAMTKYRTGKAKQGVAVKSLMEAVFRGVPQGCVIGAVSYQFQSLSSSEAMKSKMSPEQKRTLEQSTAMQPKNMPSAMMAFAALFGVQYGLLEVMKNVRKEEDIWTQAIPAAAGGAAFAVAQGHTSQILPMSLGFTAFTMIFYQLGWLGKDKEGGMAAGKAAKELQYMQSKQMLDGLGLNRYHQNVKNGLLTDATIMLWNDAALAECKIPPGPRLLIMHHINQISKLGAKAATGPPAYS